MVGINPLWTFQQLFLFTSFSASGPFTVASSSRRPKFGPSVLSFRDAVVQSARRFRRACYPLYVEITVFVGAISLGSAPRNDGPFVQGVA